MQPRMYMQSTVFQKANTFFQATANLLNTDEVVLYEE